MIMIILYVIILYVIMIMRGGDLIALPLAEPLHCPRHPFCCLLTPPFSRCSHPA
jgi:hypothetical protein